MEDEIVGYTQETYDRSIKFVCMFMDMVSGGNIDMRVPRHSSDGVGGVDLHWKDSRYELLVNIPANILDSIQYYGDNGDGMYPVEGEGQADEVVDVLRQWICSRCHGDIQQ